MHTSRGLRRGLALLAAATAATALAACSSSKGTPSASNPPTAGTTGTGAGTPTTAAATGATQSGSTQTGGAPDKQALSAMLLQPSDLPAGWTASAPSPNSPTDSAVQAQFAQCVGIRSTEPDKVAESDSSDFGNQNASISSSASSYSSPDDVTTDISAFDNTAKASQCMKTLAQTAMESSLPPNTTIDKVDLKIDRQPSGAPSNMVAQLAATITVTSSGTTLPVYLHIDYVAGKQIEADVDFENVGTPIDTTLESQLVQVVAQRVAAAG